MRAPTAVLVLCSLMFALAPASASAAEGDPWLPNNGFPNSNGEGPYVITGTGPPSVNVKVIQDVYGSVNVPNDPTLTTEYSSPQGLYRVAIGTCSGAGTNDPSPCEADAGTYRVIFYRSPNVTMWAANSLTRAGGTAISVPDYEGQPSGRQTFPLGGPSSLPPYQTITGKVSGIRPSDGAVVPLKGVRVEMSSAQGNNYSEYNFGWPTVGQTSTLTDGTYSVTVPPGTWKLQFRTHQVDNNYPVVWPSKWSGCADDFGGASLVDSGTTNANITIGTTSCTTSTPPANPGGGGPGGGGPGAGGGGGGGGGGPILGNPFASSSLNQVSSRTVGGNVTIDVNVGGSGTVAANALSSYSALARAGRVKKKKDVVVAKARKTVSRAGKVTLVLKPSRKAKKVVAKKGKLKAKVQVTFKPTTGSARTVTKSITFKRAKKRK